MIEDVLMLYDGFVDDWMLEETAKLDELVYPECYRGSTRDRIECFRKNTYSYVIALDSSTGKIVGYISFYSVSDEVYDKVARGEYTGTKLGGSDILEYMKGGEYKAVLSSVVVHPDYRKQGIARNLLRTMSEVAAPIKDILDVKFTDVVVDAVTCAGYRLAKDLGFWCFGESNHDSRVLVKSMRHLEAKKWES